MGKTLVIDYEKCVGCRTCEIACSLKHEGAIRPAQSRIGIIKWEMQGRGIPMTCSQCESARCQAACPMDAISREAPLGRVVIDHARCIGCRMCVSVCPFGALSLGHDGKRVVKCDLCDGDPLCARFCMYGALEYVEATGHNVKRRREAADKIRRLLGVAMNELA